MKPTKADGQLIEKAKDIITKSSPVNLIDTGDVGSSLITPKGNIYSGVCVGFFCMI